MRNKIYTAIAIFGMFFGLAVANAHGQAPSKVTVDIPFEFSAGKTTLQAGAYTIKRMSGNLLRLRSEHGKSTAILNAPVTQTSTNPNSIERLVFSKHGEQYFLSEIWLTADSGRDLWIDREAAKGERIQIALKR